MLWYAVEAEQSESIDRPWRLPEIWLLSHVVVPYGAMAWPTTSNPRAAFVTLRLTADEEADLDALVTVSGESKSAVLRRALRSLASAARRKGTIP